MARFSVWHVTLLLWAVLCAGVSAALDSDLDCEVASVVVIGDGRCDEEYNTQACGFDGGDCCECTCWDNEFPCGTLGYNCVDPTCDVHGAIFRDLAESTRTENPSSSPTSTPFPTPTPTPTPPGQNSETASPTESGQEPDVGDSNAEAASTSDDLSSSSTGVIVGVSAAVVLIGVGMYFYRKRRSRGYDATSEYTAAGYDTSNL